MLNSTKTWQEDFDEKFLSSGEAKLYPTLPKGYWLNTATPYKIKQFISDLRKKDEGELSKLLVNEFFYNVNTFKLKKLIKDYYQDN